MPNFEFVFFLAVLLCIVLMAISGARNSARDPFMAALIEKYRAKDNATRSVNLKMRYIGWTQPGRVISRTSAISKIGFDHEALYIKQMFLAARVIPTIRIPMDCLSLVDTKLVWSAFLKVDVFEIDGISNGRILLPVGLVAEPVKSKS